MYLDPLPLDQDVDQREQLGHGQQADPQQQGRIVGEIESVLADVGRQCPGTNQKIQGSDNKNQHDACCHDLWNVSVGSLVGIAIRLPGRFMIGGNRAEFHRPDQSADFSATSSP